MAFEDRYIRLREQLRGARARHEKFVVAPPISRAFILALLWRQSAYLVWTGSLMLLQLAEVGVLAKRFFLILPPGSLNVLRVVSSLSVAVLAVIVQARLFAPPNLANTMSAARERQRERVLAVRDTIFLVMSVLTFALIIKLGLFSRFQLTSPPAFRAVLLGSVLTLAFDASASCLLYNGNLFPRLIVGRWQRWISLVPQIVALGALWLNWPLIYLILKVAPRFLISAIVWRGATRLPVRDMFRLPFLRRPDARIYLRRWGVRTLPTLLFISSFEAAFFYVFRSAVQSSPLMSLFVYLAHRLCHLGAILALKTELSLHHPLRKRALYPSAARDHDLSLRLGVAAICFGIAATMFAPLMLLKRMLPQWSSHLGERITIPNHFIFVLALLVVARTLYAAFAFDRLGEMLSARGALKLSLPSLLSMVLVALIHHRLLLLPSTSRLFLLVLLDAGVSLVGVLLAVRSSKRKLTAGCFAAELRSPLAELLRRASDCGGQLRLLDFWPGTNETIFADEGALAKAVGPGKWARWGPRSAVICVEQTVIESVTQIFPGLLSSCEPIVDKEMLYATSKGRAATPTGGSAEPVSDRADALLASLVTRAEASPFGILTVDDTELSYLVRETSGWNLSAISDVEERGLYECFLIELTRNGDRYNPSPWFFPALKGFFHLNRGAAIGIIAYARPGKRKLAEELRYRSFMRNLGEIL